MVEIYNSSSEGMDELLDESVELVVTSPPYNVAKDYDVHDDELPLEEYEELLYSVFYECYRVMASGARISVVVPPVVDRPLIDLPRLVSDTLEDIGFLQRAIRIWNKPVAEKSSAWGSWRSASNPYEIFTHEHILTFSKEKFRREGSSMESTITKEEFMRNVKSLWTIEPVTDFDHPATFPKEIPKRLIDLYSFKGDTVLDPFMGTGTTGVAAVENERDFVGYDVSEKYCNMTRKNIPGESVMDW